LSPGRRNDFNHLSLSFPQVQVALKNGFVPVDERMQVLNFEGNPVGSNYFLMNTV
jgi:hypothetical protein